MSVLEAIILGIVQGITEFLPVSSSGHLELGRMFLSSERLATIEDALFFFVMLHVATLLPIVIVFRRDVLRLVRGLARIARRPTRIKEYYSRDADVRLASLVAVGTIPTGVIALVIERWALGGLFSGPRGAITLAVFFLLTGAALFISDRVRPGSKGILDLTLKDALIVGAIQGVAAFPGISRSGATISAGLGVGIERALAVRFSFLLSIPAISAAALYETTRMLQKGTLQPAAGAFAGAAAAAVVGFPALLAVVYLARRVKLGRFAFYLVPLGLLVLVATLLG